MIKSQAAAPLFETIAEEAMMGIMAFEGPRSHCVYINKLAKEIVNFDETKKLSDIILDDLFPRKTYGDYRGFSKDIIKHEGVSQDIVVSKLNGSSFMANIGIKRVGGGKDEILLLMFQDTTFQKKLQKEIVLKQQEIKKAYEDLLAQNKQLKELDLAKNKFIALTTHELRTPVSALVATADIIVNKLYDDEAQKDEFIKTIHEQGNHLLALVNDILDFTKLQAGKMEYFVEHADAAAIVCEQISNFAPMGAQDGIIVDFQNPDNKKWECYFDHIRLSQVIANIINNAIKFNKTNGTVTVSLKEDAKKEFTVISIADTGKGIEATKIEKVFNEFETVSDVSKHHKGTGLGMPISKRIIESMGGKISLTSEFGVGTTFEVYIPNTKVLAEAYYRSRPSEDGDLAA